MDNPVQTEQKRQLPPDNHLAWAIVSTLLCCWPFGIPAIVNAARVDKLWHSDYEEEAIIAANNAKKWAKISTFAAIAFWALYLLIILVPTYI